MRDHPLDIIHDPAARRAFTMHGTGSGTAHVYPVVSRRSKGVSIGVNLNPDKVCNFDCIYCCVDRTGGKDERQKTKDESRAASQVDLNLLREELQHMLALAGSGALFALDPFDKIPQPLRRVNDVAFSGDGEPTSCPNFMEACELAAECVLNSEFRIQNSELKTHGSQGSAKLVVITNATLFHQSRVRDALAFLDRHNGEIWAKLDAGTEAYYHLVDRTVVPFRRVLENIQWCCRTRPTVIQSLFMRVHGEAPPSTEIEAYAGRLADIAAADGRIKLVQLYTVARRTTEAYATPLTEAELEGIAAQARAALGNVPIEIYP